MALMNWNDSLSVGVKTLDEQHKGLVQTLNELHAAMMRGDAKGATGPLLDKLVRYTREHFAAEEALMSRAQYPSTSQHRTRHRDLTRQVEDYVQRYRSGEITLNVQLLNFLRDWLINHIQKEDQNYGPWMAAQGIR